MGTLLLDKTESKYLQNALFLKCKQSVPFLKYQPQA